MFVYRSNGKLVIEALELDPETDFYQSEFKFIEHRSDLNLCSINSRLVGAWERVSKFKSWNAEGLFDVLLVLVETEFYLSPQDQKLALICFSEEPVKPKASAAHPRGFKGTKFQPPKAASLREVDLRPYLCDRKSLNKILEFLWSYKDEAFKKLKSEFSLENSSVPSSPDYTTIYTWFYNLLIPLDNYPELFIEALLPRLKSLAHLAEYLDLYWSLSLEQDSISFDFISLLTTKALNENLLFWLRKISSLQGKARHQFLNILYKSDLVKKPPCQDTINLVDAILSEVNDELTPRQINLFLAIANGHDTGYLLTGFQLSQKFAPQYRFGDISFSEPIQNVERLFSCTEDFFADQERDEMLLWKICGRYSAFEKILESSRLSLLPKYLGRSFLKIYIYNIGYDLDRNEQLIKIDYLVGHLDRVLDVIVTAEFQDKAIEYIANFMWYWDKIADLENYFLDSLSLTGQLCRKPFLKHNEATEILSFFIDLLEGEQRFSLMSSPDKSFKILEKMTRSRNYAKLICNGVEIFLKFQKDFFVYNFDREPKKLFKSMLDLGCLSVFEQHEIVRVCLKQNDLLKLQAVIEDALQKSLKSETPFDQHTVQMFNFMESNKRACRKFLQEYQSGNTNYINDHQRSREWIEKQGDDFNSELWLKGLHFECEVDNSTYTIELETNPFEVLKMGTYVGSCFGLGGQFAHSSAAVALDINKQVLFMKNSKGKVVARQLLAIDKTKRLACFEVYPTNVSTAIQERFAVYDRRFAQALDYRINDSDKDLDIEFLVSESWWQDYAWDLKPNEY
ncbi:MAG: hypothetical protein NE334_21310 [Lentisphaeraceae bacterium]|nr:hypothetical protein [Lentisphaeraceae bacterium]